MPVIRNNGNGHMQITTQNTYWNIAARAQSVVAQATPAAPAPQAAPAAEAQDLSGAVSAGRSTASEFLSYMKKTPAEKVQEAWLARHGISKEEFAAMSPEEKEKLLAQMKHEIEEQMKKETAEKAQHTTDILV